MSTFGRKTPSLPEAIPLVIMGATLYYLEMIKTYTLKRYLSREQMLPLRYRTPLIEEVIDRALPCTVCHNQGFYQDNVHRFISLVFLPIAEIPILFHSMLHIITKKWIEKLDCDSLIGSHVSFLLQALDENNKP